MKGRPIRLILGSVIPILVVSAIFGVINMFLNSHIKGLAIAYLVLIGATSFAGVQTVAYSLTMEFIINKYIRNIHHAALLSGILGFMVVASAFLLAGGGFGRDPLTPFLGFFIGLGLGYMLKHNYEKYS